MLCHFCLLEWNDSKQYFVFYLPYCNSVHLISVTVWLTTCDVFRCVCMWRLYAVYEKQRKKAEGDIVPILDY